MSYYIKLDDNEKESSVGVYKNIWNCNSGMQTKTPIVYQVSIIENYIFDHIYSVGDKVYMVFKSIPQNKLPKSYTLIKL